MSTSLAELDTEIETDRQFVRLSSGLRYHYRERDGKGTPVLFLHGYADSSHSFAALIEALGYDGPSFNLDFRGHGDSDAASKYSISDLTADVIEFIARVITRPVHVVGHSMGSIVAQRVASLRPDLISKLVLIGAAPTAARHLGLKELRAEIVRFGDSVPREFVEAFQCSTVHAPVPEAVILGYIEQSLKVASSAWRGALTGLVDEPADAAQAIDASTLVLWGANDGIFGATEQAQLANVIADYQLITYPDAGHAPHWEFPKRVAADIDKFLSAV
ncbi:MAG: alpha/beta hydrolase [Hyphomicrobium sp.]|uniref:alpha/beta fold hydrolase n=1 Tax=Hyphomicrobium sp. TaxID=82 RepID=UPI0039E49B86